MSEKKVKIIYTGPMSVVVVDALNELSLVRGEPTEVPQWFADEKCERNPKQFKLAESTAAKSKKTGGEK